jgi:hypothetical protein
VWSAPEVRAYRDFVLSRRDGHGRQRITMSVSFHTSGRYILYPFGHTRINVPPEMSRLDYRAMKTLAKRMARSNGYQALQAADWYFTSGTRGGWAYGSQRIFSYTFELTLGNHPPDEQIPRETGRNRQAMLMLLELADCPYRVIGEEAAWCGPFFDDLEMDRGWRVNADGNDTARSGIWRRGDPVAGRFQIGRAASGRAVLATGTGAGVDVDGGRTTIRSPGFRVPGGRAATLRLRYWVGLGAAAGPDDGFRVRLVNPATGAVAYEALAVVGTRVRRSPDWTVLSFPIPVAPNARRLAIELEAVDEPSDDAIVEVGVDNPRVTVP